jgi:hypothetical protein
MIDTMINVALGVVIIGIAIAITREEITAITGSDLQGSQSYPLLSS